MDTSTKKGVFTCILLALVALYTAYFILSEHEAEVLLITATLAMLIIGFYVRELINTNQDADNNLGGHYLLVDESATVRFSNSPFNLQNHLAKELAIGDNLLNYILKGEFDQLQLEESIGKGVSCKIKKDNETKNIILINAGDAEDNYRRIIVVEFAMRNQSYSSENGLQHQKMLAIGQLASGIAHDFNNILTAMRGYSDLILDKISTHSDIYEYAVQLKHNITRSSFLSKQLLSFARKQDISYHNIDLYSVVLEISKLLARLIGEKVTINITKLNESNIIVGNENLIEQIIINLALNAKDAMKNGGSLNISISKTYYDKDHNFFEKLHNPCKHDDVVNGGYVLIKVNDTGMGIKLDLIDKIFDPFFSTKESAGLGVGLANVLGIVKQMNGHIFVESNNFGTSFYLIFAEVAVASESRQASSHPEMDPLAKTILLVEDEEPVRVFSAHALRSKGYNVIEAENAEQALKIYSGTKKIDIIVSDVVMPGMNGNELVAKLLKRDESLRVLLISGYTEEEIFSTEFDDSKIKFLSKPFSLRQLMEAVDFSKEKEREKVII